MNVRTWLGLATLVLGGCNDGGAGKAGAGGKAAAAQALTKGVSVKGALLRTGSMPKATATQIKLSQSDDSISMSPGGAPQLMSLEVDNPDGDPVEATLMQFSDADDHLEVPEDGDAGTSDVSIEMSAKDDICDQLCNLVYEVEMTQAVKVRGGGVSSYLKRTIKLDCTKHGDPKLCEGGDSGQGGTGGRSGAGGTGGGGPLSLSGRVSSALVSFSSTACTCTQEGPFCPSSPLTVGERNCIVDLVAANETELGSSAQCLITELGKCQTCGTPECSRSALLAMGCAPSDSALADAYVMCVPPTQPATDAGVSP